MTRTKCLILLLSTPTILAKMDVEMIMLHKEYKTCLWPLIISKAWKIFTFRFLCLFVRCVALRPKSTAMVMAGQSVHLTTFFHGQA